MMEIPVFPQKNTNEKQKLLMDHFIWACASHVQIKNSLLTHHNSIPGEMLPSVMRYTCTSEIVLWKQSVRKTVNLKLKWRTYSIGNDFDGNLFPSQGGPSVPFFFITFIIIIAIIILLL